MLITYLLKSNKNSTNKKLIFMGQKNVKMGYGNLVSECNDVKKIILGIWKFEFLNN
jgi:hypothetical protein